MARGFGWRRDKPDHRDRIFRADPALLAALPPRVDLRDKFPPIVDQGELGSCTANAIGYAHRFSQIVQGAAHFMPSRLFVYYNERRMEGTINSDAGAELRSGIKSIVHEGVCPESQWPYEIARFREQPPAECYAAALDHQALVYERVAQSIDQMKGCLASGFPFVFGFTVYQSFMAEEVARTGQMPMPRFRDSAVGGHAVTACGYDDSRGCMIVANSWSEGWGARGFFFMPYAYITHPNLAADFWKVTKVEVVTAPPSPAPQPPLHDALILASNLTYQGRVGSLAFLPGRDA